MPPADQGVERLFLAQVRPSGGQFSDRDRHRGVVGPFTWLPAEAAATHHRDLEFRAAWRTELVCGTEGIAGCRAEQDADASVELSSCQFHEQSLLSPTVSGHAPNGGSVMCWCPRRGLSSLLVPPSGVSGFG